MTGGRGKSSSARARPHFEGHQTIATADALDAWLRSAHAGEKFVYCEAPEPIRIDSWLRVPELEQQGLVHMRQERREGGGWRWYVLRSKKPLARQLSPQEQALRDEATARIFAQLKREANLGLKCSSDTGLASVAGLNTRDQAQWRVRELVRVGLIRSEIVTRGGVPTRVVTIADSGKQTLMPGVDPGLGRGGTRAAPSFPRARGGAL